MLRNLKKKKKEERKSASDDLIIVTHSKNQEKNARLGDSRHNEILTAYSIYSIVNVQFQVKKDYRTGLPRGYGFIKMKTIEDQNKILERGEFFIDGRMAQVSVYFLNLLSRFCT